MTLTHPDIKRLIGEWEAKLKELTGNETVIITCFHPRTTDMKFKIISDIICGELGVSLYRVRKQCRKREVVITRQLIIYYCCQYTNLSTTRLGKIIGGRDHSTVIHSRDKVRDYLESGDSFICEAVAKINAKIQQVCMLKKKEEKRLCLA